MSDYSAEMQRRLRAVLAARAGKPVPDDATVVIDEDALVTTMAGSILTGDEYGVAITLRGGDWAGGYPVVWHTDDEEGCVARLIRDLDAVPDAEVTAP